MYHVQFQIWLINLVLHSGVLISRLAIFQLNDLTDAYECTPMGMHPPLDTHLYFV